MRVLFVNEKISAPFIYGGSEASEHTLLTLLHQRGWQIDCWGATRDDHVCPATLEILSVGLQKFNILHRFSEDKSWVDYDYPYHLRVYQQLDIEKEVGRFLENCQESVVLMSQLNGAEKVLKVALEKEVPIILFIRTGDREEDSFLVEQIKKENRRVKMLFNSSFTYHSHRFDSIRDKVNMKILYPPLVLERYKIKENEYKPKWVTVINPVIKKGGQILWDLARLHPEIEFLAVKGWYDPLIEGIDFGQLPNVTVWDSKQDVREVYRVTKLLLVPSQWVEAFGRVGPEALVARVPVIASRQGGLPESIGEAGFYVDDYTSVEAWSKKIEEVLSWDREALDKKVALGVGHVKKFEAGKLTNELEEIIKTDKFWERGK